MYQTVFAFQNTPEKYVNLKIEDSKEKIKETTHMQHVFVLFRKITG